MRGSRRKSICYQWRTGRSHRWCKTVLCGLPSECRASAFGTESSLVDFPVGSRRPSGAEEIQFVKFAAAVIGVVPGISGIYPVYQKSRFGYAGIEAFFLRYSTMKYWSDPVGHIL